MIFFAIGVTFEKMDGIKLPTNKVNHRGRLGKRRFRERIGRSDGAAELVGYDVLG
jgi:hypothetical protein